MLFKATLVFAFAEDLCFKKNHENPDQVLITNCLSIPQKCQSDTLAYDEFINCKAISVFNFFTLPNQDDPVISHRSLLHLDATYYLAETIGFSPDDAYQIAIYDQATDNGIYIPSDQTGHSLLSEDVVKRCQLDMTADKQCLSMSVDINGVKRDDFMTSGMMLHLGARFADKPNPPAYYPFDYLTAPHLEQALNQLKEWAYDKRQTLCVGGLVDAKNECIQSTAKSPKYITGYVPFFTAGRMQHLDLNTELGDFIIHYELDSSNQIIPKSIIYSRDFDEYVKPHTASLAKFGIFLHSLQDRYSHHKCSDVSFYTKETESSANYKVTYDNKTCDQGNHMLWHGWEVGANQEAISVPINQTLKPALYATYDQLLEFANLRGVMIRENLDREKIIAELLSYLEIFEAKERLDKLTELFAIHGLQPLPGHGVPRSV